MRKKTLNLAAGLSALADHAFEIYAADGAVLVSLAKDEQLPEATEVVLRKMGWFVDSYSEQWCFCV